jgi:hypothetical protein
MRKLQYEMDIIQPRKGAHTCGLGRENNYKRSYHIIE